jgi:hypothetical protein
MGTLVIFGTAFFASLLFSKQSKTFPSAAIFFLFMFLCAISYRQLVGPLNIALWGSVWLPALLLVKKFQKYKEQNRKSNLKGSKPKLL